MKEKVKGRWTRGLTKEGFCQSVAEVKTLRATDRLQRALKLSYRLLAAPAPKQKPRALKSRGQRPCEVARVQDERERISRKRKYRPEPVAGAGGYTQ